MTTRPIIFSVDDEPDVLNAVERDLRRHYRREYRVMKAGSGREALEALRGLKKRNAAVALFIADERMPQMTGTEFLAEARQLYPDARKVLLTAYADTEAAIAGINRVGLDHYLMKPWDPPEERLYPVLDELLGDWSASYRPPFEGIRVAGAMWSPASHQVKDYLSRHQIPYEWTDVDEDEGVRATVDAMTPGFERLPVVFFPDGEPMLEPSLPELAERVGLRTKATEDFYDVVVIGAGPSGLAGAVYGASEGLRTALVECEVPGGQAGTSSAIENYLGFPSGITGADLARRAAAQAKRFGTNLVAPARVTGVRTEHPYHFVTLDDGSELSCYAMVLSTGMQVRRLDVPGVDDLSGAGVYYGAALSEAASCRDKDVFIVGGANSAGQATMLFSRYARKVTMLVRAPSLTKSMSQYLITRIEQAPNIEVMTETRVVGVTGDKRLEAITLERADGTTMTMPSEAMFIFIGTAPNSDFLPDALALDDAGFVLTGLDLLHDGRRPAGWPLDRDPFLLETNVPGIFAAGDVRHGSTKRVAAAVGEGSSAIGMVHRYLETV
jgi:thioredoxin reductase (NADPH)